MNEHNPVALAISMLQEKWRNAVKDSDYRFVRWVIERENADIFKGFLKLESTPHGSLEETFIILFTPFETPYAFAYALANDWLEIFEHEMQQGTLPQWDDLADLKEELQTLSSDANYQGEDIRFLMKLLKSFKQYEGKKAKLVVGLLPYAVAESKQYVKWLDSVLYQLPNGLMIMTVDYCGHETQERLFGKENPERISLMAKNLFDANKIYRQLATAGNPDDPQVVFRTCMFEMGEAAKNGNKQGVYHWGEKALLATQGSGDKLFWAAAHIVYVGFLFGFKDTEKIEKLIENGNQICEQLLTDENQKNAAAELMAQFYGYKAAYLNILKKYKESIACFEQQAALLIANGQAVLSLGAFQNALLVAARHQSGKVPDIAGKGFAAGYPLADELLRTSGFPVIAYHYLKHSIADDEQRKEIEHRMAYLYTDEWKHNAKKHFAIAPEEYVSS